MSVNGLQTLAQYYYDDTVVEQTSSGNWFYSPFGLAITIVMLISMWFVFKKAKRPGWVAIIPIYNTLVGLWIIGRPWWWLLLLFLPFVNIVVYVIVQYETSKVFGKGAGFALLLIFLPFIGYPILAFGSAKYKAPKKA